MLTRLTELVSRICGSFRRGHLDSDFDEELQSHLAMLEEDNIRRGMQPKAALSAARVTLGCATQVREAHRDAQEPAAARFADARRRYALRSLKKTPGFTATRYSRWASASAQTPQSSA